MFGCSIAPTEPDLIRISIAALFFAEIACLTRAPAPTRCYYVAVFRESLLCFGRYLSLRAVAIFAMCIQALTTPATPNSAFESVRKGCRSNHPKNMKTILTSLVVLLLSGAFTAAHAFNHPCIPQTAEDLAFI